MYWLLRIFHFYIPSFLKKKGLEELFKSTSAAFKQNVPSLKGISYNKSMIMYARFTKNEIENYIDLGGNRLILQNELNKNAIIFGKKLRKFFSVKSFERAVSMFGLLYGFIRIDLKFSGHNELSVKQCFFSNYYSAQVCSIISAIDSGVFEGLSGGSVIEFRQRITEGHNCCKACVLIKQKVY